MNRQGYDKVEILGLYELEDEFFSREKIRRSNKGEEGEEREISCLSPRGKIYARVAFHSVRWWRMLVVYR